MQTNYLFIPDLLQQIPEIQADSIISRTLYQDEQVKVVLFGFAPGQELSEHTASVPAIIHILEGSARLTLGQDTYEVQNGSWARMPANLSHSLQAKTKTTMLLLMLREKKA
jgi:quercetin dioxygenase-like cupin family protein